MSNSGHPIDLDLKKILPILAREIYTTPFAFLRENVQNAYDAIRMQIYRESTQGGKNEHRVIVTVSDDVVSIRDSGIGMTQNELKEFFWSIGKSGKHTDEAKTAGVVGTFGIGGMANFGVCSRVDVLTRVENSAKSVACWAEEDKLSAQTDSVFYSDGPEGFARGTEVLGQLKTAFTAASLRQYLAPIVEFLEVPVEVEGTCLSGKSFPTVKREGGTTRSISHGLITARMYIRALKNGQATIEIDELVWNGAQTPIRCVLNTGGGVLSAYQHGFMLANVPVSSIYGLGGQIDCSVLRPTAGREAVTDESRGLVNSILSAVETGLTQEISSRPGLSDHYSAFFRCLTANSSWQLAQSSQIKVFGSSSRVLMSDITSTEPKSVFFAHDGHDHAILQAYSEKGKTVAILSADRFRQKVERNYLATFCSGELLEDSVTCLRIVEDLGVAKLSLLYRLESILRSEFFVGSITIKAGDLSHQAMAWVPPNTPTDRMVLFLDFGHSNIERLIELRSSLAFDNACLIFARDYILPHLEQAFPELKRRDFDLLLQKLQSSVEYFEIDPSNVDRIQQLAAITNMSPETLAVVLGARKPGRAVSTDVDKSDVRQVSQVVQESSGLTLDEILDELKFKLLEIEVDAKLLDARDCDPSIGLADYYIAVTPEAHVLYRRVFTERRPSSDFSWGGYRAGYLFYSEGQSVIHYDMQFPILVDPDADRARSGTIRMEVEPLIFSNMVYLPVPDLLVPHVVPDAQSRKFNVRHQIMGVFDSNSFDQDTFN